MPDKIAIFCNGFEDLVSKMDRICREKYQSPQPTFLAFIRRDPFAPHVSPELEEETQRLQPETRIIRKASDLWSLMRTPLDVLVVADTLGAKRTLLALVIATLTRARIVEFDLQASQFHPRWKIGYFGTFLRSMASRRTLNHILLSISSSLQLPRLLSYPVNMLVETVAVCNLRCPACATGLNALGRAQGFMDFAKYERMITECGPYLDNLVLHIYGEPLLHKQITSFIQTAKKNGARNVELSTNANVTMTPEAALQFVKSGLNTLVVSMDGADEEAYKIYRVGGKLSMLLEFIKTIVRAKEEAHSLYPIIRVQFIIMKHNIHQIDQARDMALSLGADIFRTKMFDAQFADIGLEAATALLPDSETAKFFKVENGKLVSMLATDNNFCHFVWDTAAMTWDGHVIPCCFDEKASVILGDTFHVENNFWDVWNSKKFVSFRKAMLVNRKKIPLCKDCPYV